MNACLSSVLYLAIIAFSLRKTEVILVLADGEEDTIRSSSVHYLDDFFFDKVTFGPSTSFQPSSSPSTSPSIHPTSSPSQHPSDVPTVLASNNPSTQPSYSPSQRPSVIPSSFPSYSLQEFDFSIMIEFDEFRERQLDDQSKHVFESTMKTLVSNSVQKLLNEDFFISVDVIGYELLESNHHSNNRHLSSSLLRRRIQHLNVGIRILVDLYVSLRSEKTLRYNILNKNIKSTLDTIDKREEFIFNLQQSDTNFYPINVMTVFKINNEEVKFLSYRGHQNVLVGLGVSIVGVLVCCAGYISFRTYRRRKANHIMNTSSQSLLWDTTTLDSPRSSDYIIIEMDKKILCSHNNNTTTRRPNLRRTMHRRFSHSSFSSCSGGSNYRNRSDEGRHTNLEGDSTAFMLYLITTHVVNLFQNRILPSSPMNERIRENTLEINDEYKEVPNLDTESEFDHTNKIENLFDDEWPIETSVNSTEGTGRNRNYHFSDDVNSKASF